MRVQDTRPAVGPLARESQFASASVKLSAPGYEFLNALGSFFDEDAREMDHRFLQAAVETGQAVDDSRVDHPGRPQMSVDRIPWEQHAALLEEIAAAVS